MERAPGNLLTTLTMSAVLPLALMLGAGTAGAQWNGPRSQRHPDGRRSNNGQQELFVWQGRVDREIRIQMNGRRASVLQIGSNERATGGVRAMGSVPNQDGIVTVQKLEGRGDVDIVQQPDRRNGYTAIFRLRDKQSGAATYRIAAYWQPIGNSGVYRNESRRGRGDPHNGGYDDNYGYGRGHDHW